MKHPKHILLWVCLLCLSARGQTFFDNYYKTGYHNNKSSNVIAEPDSNFLFVNYIIDSATYRQDIGLMRLDKNGNELLKRSFNMFNQSCYSFTEGEKNFIHATSSSYFLASTYYVGNDQGFIITKFNKTTLDTIKSTIYADTFTYAVRNLIKFNDNKYYLVGNKWLGNDQSPVIIQLDSNLNIIRQINVNTTKDFGYIDATINPQTKKILIIGGTASGQYLNTFIHLDTLGSISQTKFGSKYYQNRHILQIFYSSIDSSYVAVGDLKTSVSGGFGQYRLCISKYDVNLKLKWEKTYGEAMPENTLFDGVILNDGSIAVSGLYSIPVLSPTAAINKNGVILKVDKTGNLLWAKEYDHVPADDPAEILYSIDKTLDKGFIVCGTVFGPTTLKSKAWAIKTDSMGCAVPGCVSTTMQTTSVYYPPDTSTVGVPLLPELKNKFRIFPNPARELLTVQVQSFSAAEKKEYGCQVLNNLGELMMNVTSFDRSITFDLHTLKTGLYFVRVVQENRQIFTGKFVKE